MSEQKSFLYQTKISNEAMDSLGHVNHAYYLTLFEYARWQILEQKNLRDRLMNELKIGPIILEANVKYKAELKLEDEITIQSRFEPFKRDLIFKAIQSMHRGEDLISEGEYIISFMDLKQRKMCQVPPDIRDALFNLK